MKTKPVILAVIAVVGVLALSTRCGRKEESLTSITNQLQQANATVVSAVSQQTNVAAIRTIRFVAQPGSKIRMDGTSTIHDWNVESRIIGGFLEFDEGFSLAALKPGKIKARVEAIIPVSSLKSSSGRPMDSIMYEAMNQAQFPRIEYRLRELTCKELPAKFEAIGDLLVSGVTNRITQPVTMESPTHGQLRIAGATTLKMTDFGIKPPAPSLGGVAPIKTGDEVRISFEWVALLKSESRVP